MTRLVCRTIGLLVLSVLLQHVISTAQAGSIFLPGKLADGQFVLVRKRRSACRRLCRARSGL